MLDEVVRLGARGLAFERPDLLPLTWFALGFLVVPVVLRLRGRAPTLRLVLASVLRSIAFVCAVLAAAGATLVDHVQEENLGVVALVDSSASIRPEERSWMQERLGEIAGNMRRDDELAVVEFGRSARLRREPGPPEPPDLAGMNPAIDGSATNLMAALDSGGRIGSIDRRVLVLLSDGNQTVGDAAVAAEALRRRGVKLYSYFPTRTRPPLHVEHVAAPDTVREGQDVTLTVAVANDGEATRDATLVVRQGTTELGRVPIRVSPGRSVVDAKVRAGHAGHYAIHVSLEAEAGVASAQAARAASLTILSPPRILVIGRSPTLANMIRDAGFEVEQRPRLDAATDADLAVYHAVVLADVGRSDLDPNGLAALERTVRDRGGGLLLAAGRGLLLDSALRRSPLERILPVRVKEEPPKPRERDPMALFLVIDRSSSMLYGMNVRVKEPSRMTYAREAALALIGQLEDRDLVGAAAFDTETSLLSPLSLLGQSRASLTDVISRLNPSGGTDFKDALEIAGRQLVESGRKIKHIILLTDGASLRPAGEHEQLVQALAQSGVTVTSIRIGEDQENADLIQWIAQTTGGTFYQVTDGGALPNVMIHDAEKRAGVERPRKSPRANEPAEVATVDFRPKLARRAQALSGFTDQDLPLLHEMAVVPMKDGADAWLTSDHAGDRSPVMAAWQIGLGRVVVFTADPSEEWQSWANARRFWAQTLRWVARPQSGDELRLEVRDTGGGAELAVTAYAGAADDEMIAVVTGLDGGERRVPLVALGGRRFSAALPPADSIERRVVIERRGRDGAVQRREEWLPEALPAGRASIEEAEAEPNQRLLQQLAEITGGAVDAPLATLLARAPADRQVPTPIGQPLAVAALALVLADVVLRALRGAAFPPFQGGAGPL